METTAPIGAIVSVVGALTTITMAYISFRRQSTEERSQKATQSDMVLDAWQEIISPLRSELAHYRLENSELKERVSILELEREELKRRMQTFEAGVSILVNHIMAKGDKPPWVPDSRGNDEERLQPPR